MKNPVTIREIILFGTCLFLAFFLIKGCNNNPFDTSKYISKELFDASQDSLHKSRNEFGEEETKTKLLQGTISDLKNLSSSKDSSIQKLIKLVNKKTISASVLSNTTAGTITSSTSVTSKDTLRKDSLIYLYPTYVMKPVVTRWDSVSAVATKDTFLVKYKIYNDFNFTQEYEKKKVKGKIFKSKVAIVKVVNLNPKTETKELKSFAVTQPSQKKGLIFSTGIILGIVLRQIIFK